jgi:predicted nucleic acid-binding protein
MILDSSYLFDLMRNDSAAFEKGVELVERGGIQRLPTPVVAEAYYGVFTSGSDRTEAELRSRLLGYPRADVTEEIARTAGKLLARAREDHAAMEGRPGANDAYIGAMAGTLDDAVLTENAADFEKLGVAVETY